MSVRAKCLKCDGGNYRKENLSAQPYDEREIEKRAEQCLHASKNTLPRALARRLFERAVNRWTPDQTLDPLLDRRMRAEKIRQHLATDQRLHDEQVRR